MSMQVKLGRWQMRNGETAVVVGRCVLFGWPWRGYREQNREPTSWSPDGTWGPVSGPFDLMEYLGPEEPKGGEL